MRALITDVWFAPMEDIAAYVLTLIDEGTWHPRVDKLPYYTAPVRIDSA